VALKTAGNANPAVEIQRKESTMAELTDKVALVTGASRGIGAAVARAFSDAGCAVVVAARDVSALDGVARELRADGGEALAVPTDVTDDGAVEEMVASCLREFGRLDYACNNAGGAGHPPTPLADVPLDAFDAAIAVSLRGVFVSMRHEIPAMLESGGGAIVNISSTAGHQGVGGLAAYVSAKYAVEGVTRVAALDYAAQGIRVNAIAPGPILTDNLARAGADVQKLAAAAMPIQRVGRPDEVADAVTWLCSDHAGFVTGATLVIDGGKLAGTPPFQVKLRPE
jgi:NAD(P)-dependent dehydrogenase (short-subunit alcohol dehydrogenase family)